MGSGEWRKRRGEEGMSQNDAVYDLRVIRELLVGAFDPKDLQRLCMEHPRLRPIVANFGAKYSLNEMIDEVIHYCETEVLWDEFLAAIRDVKPNQYARFESRLRTAGYAGAGPPRPGATAAGLRESRGMRGLVPASIGVATAFIVFLILLTTRYYQAAVTLGALLLATVLCLAVYSALAKAAQGTTDDQKPLAARRRLWAVLGILAVVAVIAASFAVRPIRHFIVSAFAGTPTPIATQSLEAPAALALSTDAAPLPQAPKAAAEEAAVSAPRSSSTPTPMPVPTRANPVSTAVVRIDSETLNSGTVSELSHLLVEDMVYGRILVVVPGSISAKRATAVHLLVFPDNESDWVYPVMVAELNGAGFEIRPDGPQRQAVVSGQTARWSWSIWTQWTGSHDLVLSISTEIPLDGEGAEDRLALGSIPIAVNVVRAPTGVAPSEAMSAPASAPESTAAPEAAAYPPTVTPQPFPSSPSATEPTIAWGTAGFLMVTSVAVLALLSVRKYNSRESAVSILEQRLSLELDQETRAEIRQEIARLQSARWWQFWK
jgi:hypothetical protein